MGIFKKIFKIICLIILLFTLVNSINLSAITIVIDQEGVKDDMGFIGGMSLNTNKISKNGSVLLSNGVVIIKEEDIELYIKGELVFYSVDTIYK